MADEPQYAIAVNHEMATTDLFSLFEGPIGSPSSFTFEFRYEGRPVLTFRGEHMEVRHPAPDALIDMMRKANEYDRLAAATRSLVIATRRLREALGISEDEWRDSDQR